MENYPMKEKGISLYYQIEKYIRTKIESGEWPEGAKLPTESDISHYFNVSRTTVRQAINGMVESGMLVRKQGSGTYVTQPPYARKRLSKQPSDLVCKYIYAPILQEDLDYSYQNLIALNIAHVLMLYKQTIISREDAKALLSFITPLSSKYPKAIGSNPLNEDFYLNFEQYVISNLGLELGGKMHIARSRNDLTPTIARMSIRDSLFVIYDRLLKLRSRLLDLAEENKGYILTGYTHMQPAQPITLDYYFLAISEALKRDFSRLLNAYHVLNRCPLGSCALAGTSYPIDRQYTSSLLGFDGVLTNSLDAVASRDYLLELSADFATLGSTISRFAQDLYVWSTAEFHLIDFSDSVSCCSSIMPQKKNPLSIEHIKSKTAHLGSAYIDILLCLKGTSFTHSRDLFECMPTFWDCCYQMQAVLELLIDALQDIVFHYDRMQQMADSNDSVLTDLADALVQKDGFSFRIAHNIVSTVVKRRKEADSKAKISLDLLNEVSMDFEGRSTSLTQEELSGLLTAEVSISRKISEGSPSRASCETMLLNLQTGLSEDETILQELINSVKESENLRMKEVDAIL